MLEEGEYSYCPTGAERAETFTSSRKKKSNKNSNKRRFSDEQIQSLETMFESEARLEPRKKLQLARELGLQPRQVAIWFQNKRARWKSKQLERDYGLLRANYNSLASRFESLKKEKQTLLNQLQQLNDLVRRSGEESGGAVNSIINDGESDNEEEETKSESQVKPKVEHGGGGVGGALSDDDSSIKAANFLGLGEENNLVNMADDSLTTSHEDWDGFNSHCLFDDSSSGYQWWDFWS